MLTLFSHFWLFLLDSSYEIDALKLKMIALLLLQSLFLEILKHLKIDKVAPKIPKSL